VSQCSEQDVVVQGSGLSLRDTQRNASFAWLFVDVTVGRVDPGIVGEAWISLAAQQDMSLVCVQPLLRLAA
jgi:hypothetical protein